MQQQARRVWMGGALGSCPADQRHAPELARGCKTLKASSRPWDAAAAAGLHRSEPQPLPRARCTPCSGLAGTYTVASTSTAHAEGLSLWRPPLRLRSRTCAPCAPLLCSVHG